MIKLQSFLFEMIYYYPQLLLCEYCKLVVYTEHSITSLIPARISKRWRISLPTVMRFSATLFSNLKLYFPAQKQYHLCIVRMALF
jgi:hypothetical protein